MVVLQQETGATYSIAMKQMQDTLQVTQFTLTHPEQLAFLSPDLHEIAFLEIFVKALAVVFAYAERWGTEEIFFILSGEDALVLGEFHGFFDVVEPVVTQEGNKISFTIYNTSETRAFLKAKTTTIKTKLKQELWQLQRHDRYIKNYLQNHQRGTLLPCLNQQDAQVNGNIHIDNIIPFPQRGNK